MMGFLRLPVLAIIVFELWLLAWRAIGAGVQCLEKEREALLRFKAALGDDSSSLVRWSSWGGKEHNRDCCQWEGVLCNNQTGHVIKLHLPGDDFPNFLLKGEIHASLMELQYLMYLNLSSNYFEDSSIPEFLGSLSHLRYLDLHNCGLRGGNIPSQLGLLSNLQYLDLSKNLVEGAIPYQFKNLSQLQHLDLSYNFLERMIPHQLENLLQLQYLNLSYNFLEGAIPYQLGNISQLHYLDLSCNSLEGVIPYQLENLSQLRYLNLSENSNLKGPIPYQLGNLVQLEHLDLSRNNLRGSIPSNLGNLSQLQYLDLSYNSFSGIIPYQLGNLSKLQNLLLCSAGTLKTDQENGAGYEWLSSLISLTHLNLGAMTDLRYSNRWLQMIAKLPNLKELIIKDNDLLDEYIPSLHTLKFNSSSISKLDFSRNNFESFKVFHWILNVSTNLVDLSLYSNNLKGLIPYEFISMMNSLENLDLGSNQITGIPEDFQFPSSLVSLDIHSNSLKGILTDSHLANMHKLKFLDLSDNSLTLKFSHNWVPPFQLEAIYLRSCRLGPDFPEWLQTQNNFTKLDISNAGISGTVPKWFWGLLTPGLKMLNVSCNNISGIMPNVDIDFVEYPIISLASNQFEGSLPKFLQNSRALFLSNNSFSELHIFLCANRSSYALTILDLSNNQLYGQLPDCWSPFKSLRMLDLSNNNISGEFPVSIGSLQYLEVLILSNNGLTGELPITLRSCSNLAIIDVGENKFFGHIPSWIGNELQNLEILILRNNNISGRLPTHLCYLSSLHLLDLSLNVLSGQIPSCFKNITLMPQGREFIFDSVQGRSLVSYDSVMVLVMKGRELFILPMITYNEPSLKKVFDLSLKKGIDLSCNELTGKIPPELGMLVELISLNLSRNQLDGEIPSEIGRLTSLNSLDLSRNHLFGPVPSSLAQIDGLTTLDLSHNNLSGKIPTSVLLQNFDKSSYEGNIGLCGKPMEIKCPQDEQFEESVKFQENNDLILSMEFYWSITFGFTIGFWGTFGPILFNRSWRHAYFKFLNNLTDTIYVMVVLNVRKCNRWFRSYLEKLIR